MYQLTIQSPLGPLCAVEENNVLTHLCLPACAVPPCPQKQTPLLLQAKQELMEYFAGKRKTFSLPLAAKGTPFQHQVWQALLEVPYGQCVSYGAIARRIGRPKACRAVGMACHQNPLAIVIPCHRVVGGNGSLTGYAAGISVKKKLLDLEKRFA